MKDPARVTPLSLVVVAYPMRNSLPIALSIGSSGPTPAPLGVVSSMAGVYAGGVAWTVAQARVAVAWLNRNLPMGSTADVGNRIQSQRIG